MDEEEPDVVAALREEGLSLGRPGIWTDPDQEVGVAVHVSGLFVGWLDVAWPHPTTPAAVLKGIVHVAEPRDERSRADLRAQLRRARKQRTRLLRVCSTCGESVVPGLMHEKDLCQACAERDRGVVH